MIAQLNQKTVIPFSKRYVSSVYYLVGDAPRFLARLRRLKIAASKCGQFSFIHSELFTRAYGR